MNPEEALAGLRGEQVVFAPNPGNAGDGLIAAAEYFLLRKLGVAFRVADANAPVDVQDSETVIYGGGGNLVGLYGNARRYLTACHSRAKKVIILPHTIRENEELIASFGRNVMVFCREQESFDHVRGINSILDCHLADDMALALPAYDILKRSPELGFREVDRMTVRRLKRLVRVAQYTYRSRGAFMTLNAFRSDVEGCGREREKLNLDVSQVFSGDDMSEEACRETAYSVFKFLNRFDKVRTDRLHVCIGAALLGKKTEFYDNSYGKNSSVYRYSMAKRFPNVELMMG